MLIPATEFVLMDADGYAPSWLWITNSAHTFLNTTAALVNRILFGVILFEYILRNGVFWPSASRTVDYIRQHIDRLMVMNENVLHFIDKPDIFQHRKNIFHARSRKLDLLEAASDLYLVRAMSDAKWIE